MLPNSNGYGYIHSKDIKPKESKDSNPQGKKVRVQYARGREGRGYHITWITSQKVVNNRTLAILLLGLLFSAMDIVLRRCGENIEIPFARVTDFKHAGQIATSVAVIWRAPNSAKPVVVEYLIPFLAQLMRAQNMRHTVHLKELPHHLCPKGVSCTARGERELVAFGVGIRPDQIGHGALVRDLTEAVYDLDLVDRVNRRGETTMHAEYLVVDHNAQRKKIEHVGEIVPNVGVAVFPSALGIKPVRLGHAAGLVISADKMHTLRVSQFQAHKEGDGLDAEKTTIYIIAYKSQLR